MGESDGAFLEEDLTGAEESVSIGCGGRIECVPFLDMPLDVGLKDRFEVGDTRVGFCWNWEVADS